eukprot:EG_transcript_6696
MESWTKWLVPAMTASTIMYFLLRSGRRIPRPRSGHDYYDLIIKLDDFMSVCRKGWLIDDRRMDIESWKGVIVTVLGDFNKGKTHVLNRLTGTKLPSGINIRTEGLSFKRMKLARKEVCLLDTAGGGSPVRSVTPAQLQQKKAMEKFLRDVVFECADVFLYILNDISAEEQIQLHSLALSLEQSTKEDKRIIVIHNLRERATLEEMNEARLKIVDMYVSTGTYTLTPEDVTDDLTGVRRTIDVLYGLKECRLAKYQMHLFIGKDNTPAGELNPWAFSKVRQTLNNVCARQEYRIQDKVLNSFSALLPKYIEGPRAHLLLVPDEADPQSHRYLRAVPEVKYQQMESTRIVANMVRICRDAGLTSDDKARQLPDFARQLLAVRPVLKDDLEEHLQWKDDHFKALPCWDSAGAMLEHLNASGSDIAEEPDGNPRASMVSPAGWSIPEAATGSPLSPISVNEKQFQVRGPAHNDELEAGQYKLKPQPLPYFLSAEQTDGTSPPFSVIETSADLWIFVELPGVVQPKLAFRPMLQGGGFKFLVSAWKEPPLPQSEVLRTHSDTRVLGTPARPLQFTFTVPSVFEMPQSAHDGAAPPVGTFKNGVLSVRFRKLPEGDQELRVA